MPLNPKSLLQYDSIWRKSLGKSTLMYTEYIFSFLPSLWILYECPDLPKSRGRRLEGGDVGPVNGPGGPGGPGGDRHLGAGRDCRVQVFHRTAICLQHVTVEWRCNKSGEKKYFFRMIIFPLLVLVLIVYNQISPKHKTVRLLVGYFTVRLTVSCRLEIFQQKNTRMDFWAKKFTH